jgi:hypothetical protein
MRALISPLLLIPLVGPVAWVALGPFLEAVGVTLAGDWLGDGRAALVWPWLASVGVGGTGALITALSGGLFLASMALAFLSLGPPWVPSAMMGPLEPLGFMGLAGLALAASAAGMLASVLGTALMALSPLASTAIYQWAKKAKDPADNGSGFISLFSARNAERAP